MHRLISHHHGAMAVVGLMCVGAVGCATPERKSAVDQVLADVDNERDESLSTSDDLSRLRWKAQALRTDVKSPYAGRELALVDTWLAGATALSVMPDRDEARYALLLDAVATTLGSIQALYVRLDAEAELEAARTSFVNDRAVLAQPSASNPSERAQP